MDVYTIDPNGGPATRLTDGDVVASNLAWSPDGSRITFASWPADNWYRPREIHVVDRDGSTPVSTGLDGTASQWGPPVWLDTETILAGVANKGWVRPYAFDASADAPTPRFEAFGRDRSVRLIDVGGDQIVCSVDDPDDGHELYALARADLDAPFDEAATRLTAFNEELLEAPATFHRLKSTHDDAEGDGEPVTVESMVYTPPGFEPVSSEPRPTILWPHGGPMSYDDPEFSFTTNYFTSRGYIVLKPNYRGSSSYGRAFCETLRGRWGSVEIVDQLAALDDLVERGWADPDRLFATGFSYGGISTAFLVTETNRFAAAAPEHGIYDRRSSFGTGDSQVWNTNELGVPWENPERYAANSSITAVDQIETPLLITAGEDDWRCPPTQAEQLYVSVRKQGIDAKLVLYQNEHHNVGDPDRAIHRVETLEAWFERHDPITDDD
ncbi:MAG: prolyl oligopeptidase family [halophilic archaeon J07HX5]|jgi:Dipeptidyl aminopeptidases/acylaminoacyl-peptidases|nr:MAG: prolyl oligopeptidase family [halophilic archaeon J07HX5]